MPRPAPANSPQDDPGLIEGLQRRDPQAMGRLYDAFGRAVYSLVYRIVQDPGVAEDLVQETFLRVWNQAHVFDPSRGSPAAWVLTMARNRAIDWVRAAAGRPEHSVWESYDSERPENFQDAEKALISAEQGRRVRRAMEKLNENQRLVIEMAYFQGFTQSEMAERMAQPLGTVKTWVRTALQHLRQELAAAS
ncbi:MAG: sigma-70 family RNA polymerase sigma factor [Acidobacteria bacterium]|nr:sigma-70 family RNA polymerase sigma factor [Acidobacteriota bacterium]